MTLAGNLMSDDEWTFFEGFIRAVRHPNGCKPADHRLVLMTSSGSCGPVRPGGTCQRSLASGHPSAGSSGTGRSPDCGRHPGCLEPREARARQAPDDRHRAGKRHLSERTGEGDQGPPPCGRRKGGAPKQAPGRSRGGFSTGIHLRVNGAGLPMRTGITPGRIETTRAMIW